MTNRVKTIYRRHFDDSGNPHNPCSMQPHLPEYEAAFDIGGPDEMYRCISDRAAEGKHSSRPVLP